MMFENTTPAPEGATPRDPLAPPGALSAEAPEPASLIDAMDELHTAQHLTGLLCLAGEALLNVDINISNAITTGVYVLKSKLEEVDALLEELHERGGRT